MLIGPPEIDIYILSFLDIKDLYRISSVNKYLYTLFKNEDLWKEKLLTYPKEILNFKSVTYKEILNFKSNISKEILNFKSVTYKELYLQCYRVLNDNLNDHLNNNRNKNFDHLNKKDIDAALYHKYLAPVYYLLSIDKFVNIDTLNGAILSGNDKIVEILLDKKVKLNSDSHIDTTIAASRGYLNVLQMLDAKEVFPDTLAKWCVSNAARSNQITVLEWLKSKNILPNRGDANFAAKCGHLEALKWCHANGISASKYGANCACENNHLEVLKWLETVNILPDYVGADNAHHRSHVRILIHLSERNIFPSEWIDYKSLL